MKTRHWRSKGVGLGETKMTVCGLGADMVDTDEFMRVTCRSCLRVMPKYLLRARTNYLLMRKVLYGEDEWFAPTLPRSERRIT